MKTIHTTFKIGSKTIKRTAILTDDLSELSSSKKNQCGDIIDDTIDDGIWSLIFFESDNTQYQVVLEYDHNNKRKTFKPIKCIVWEKNIIDDEINVTIK